MSKARRQKVYEAISASLDHGRPAFVVTVNRKLLPLDPSLKIRSHSPDGFSWGYGGSGPAQLALAILLDYTGSQEIAQRYYQRFKEQVIAGLQYEEGWKITGSQIFEFLQSEGDNREPKVGEPNYKHNHAFFFDPNSGWPDKCAVCTLERSHPVHKYYGTVRVNR